MDADKVIGAVKAVTGKWARQRKAEERNASRKLSRDYAMTRVHSVSLKEAAWQVMGKAYLKTSNNNTLPAHARQIMYVARPEILDLCTEKAVLDDKYFTNTLLPDYMKEHPQETADWDVVFDARGALHEPHTGTKVPLGTLDVRRYLGDVTLPRVERRVNPVGLFPTSGPRNRYGAILFIEKEGFMPLFQAVNLAERYDLAIMSTKGMSVTAARHLVDRLCSEHNIPLLVLHDFDGSGFSIVGTFRRATRRYSFANPIEVVDLGLRLGDLWANGLELEPCVCTVSKGKLRENGAADEEIDVLLGGKRVELNAFLPKDLVAWTEAKLQANGVRKVVPGQEVLEKAFRQAAADRFVDVHLETLNRKAREHAGKLTLPYDLAGLVLGRLQQHPDEPWDVAVRHFLPEG
jgi:hypothetical protein